MTKVLISFSKNLSRLFKNSIYFSGWFICGSCLIFPDNDYQSPVCRLQDLSDHCNRSSGSDGRADAAIDSLEALSKKYWYRENYLDWYNRLSGLMPLLRRCLEYIIYVFVASLVVLQGEIIFTIRFLWAQPWFK